MDEEDKKYEKGGGGVRKKGDMKEEREGGKRGENYSLGQRKRGR